MNTASCDRKLTIIEADGVWHDGLGRASGSFDFLDGERRVAVILCREIFQLIHALFVGRAQSRTRGCGKAPYHQTDTTVTVF